MKRILKGVAALALGLSSYAWAEPADSPLGAAFRSVTAARGSGKPAAAGLAGAARGADHAVKRYAAALDGLAPEGRSVTRGSTDARIYQAAAGAVVLVVGDDGFGSGALVGADGLIVTNLHVVGEADEVGVVFKPAVEGGQPDRKDVRLAKVVRRDGIADLALIKVSEVPAGTTPLKLAGSGPVQVGSDVHAIGHPTGEGWTYTRGIVSQVRHDYRWAAQDKVEHKATVIQTQTPINPGNSGGPLIDDNLEIVGINSFKGEGEGLNFAVSAEDVKAVLAMTADRAAPAPKVCEAREISSKPSTKPKGVETWLDTDCDGKSDVIASIPDSKREPILYMADDDGDGKIDTVLVDDGHDGQMDLAMYDTDGDGEPDVHGYYRKGEDEPYRLEKVKK